MSIDLKLMTSVEEMSIIKARVVKWVTYLRKGENNLLELNKRYALNQLNYYSFSVL